MKKRTLWIAASLVAVLLGGGALTLFLVGQRYVRNFEPRIKQALTEYLEKRFESEVELKDLRVHIGRVPPISAVWNKGRGVGAVVEASGLVMRQKGRRDIPPMFAIRLVRCEFDLGTLLDSPRSVPTVFLDGMEINVPPKGDRPSLAQRTGGEQGTAVVIGKIFVHDAKLTLLPKPSAKRRPLLFEIMEMELQDAGPGQAMHYKAELINPRPKGLINSEGTFGPWDAEEPGASPLNGTYIFRNADLGIFRGIAGILNSTGRFHGELSSVTATGSASVPDFRLKRAGQAVPLVTQFEVEVDGTNGNTTLKPVYATLGSTKFVTEGTVIKHETGQPRAIDLIADMPAGDMRDIMRLAMKGAPMMEGTIKLHTKIEIPPLSGKVREKLILDGKFVIDQGRFTKDAVQDKVDELSRRGQGQPKNLEISDTFSAMKGEFHMEDEAIMFRALQFAVPGAQVKLTGNYDMDADQLNFLGTLALDAKVSQTLTGWKRWLAKPIDPLFAKNGSGTYLGVTVNGSAKKPAFGASRNTKAAEEAFAAAASSAPLAKQ